MKKGSVFICVLLGAVLIGAFTCRIFHDHSNLAPGEPFSASQKAEVIRTLISHAEKNGYYVNPDVPFRWEDDPEYVGKHLGPGVNMYFGIFNNAIVIYSKGSAAALGKFTIGDYRFVFSTPSMPTVIFGGDCYSLREAYEAGILTDENIGEIYDYCREKFSHLYS